MTRLWKINLELRMQSDRGGFSTIIFAGLGRLFKKRSLHIINNLEFLLNVIGSKFFI